MNIYKFELKMLRSSILIWGLSIPLILFAYMAFYPTIAADTAAFDALMANYPKELLAFFGMRSDLPMSSLLGYFSLTFGMMQIPIAIQAANYGIAMLSVEEREMTADFLLTKPISRTKIMVSKFLASLTSLLIVNAGIWAATIGALYAFKGDSTFELHNVILVLATVILFQLFFVGVGMAISVAVKKVPSVIAYSMSLGFGLYILFGLKSTFSNKIMSFFTPYAYFEPAEILVNGHLDLLFTLICSAVIVISFALAYFLYDRRNIHSL